MEVTNFFKYTSIFRIKHRWQIFHSEKLSILTIGNENYMIGVQIAHLLKRETFNLYRSLKVKGIRVFKAQPFHIDYLISIGSIRPGTRSVTLVGLEDIWSFIEREYHIMEENNTNKKLAWNGLVYIAEEFYKIENNLTVS